MSVKSAKFNKRAILIFVAVIAAIALVGGSLAWFVTQSSLVQRFSISGIKAGAEVYFDNGSGKINAEKYLDKDGLYALSLDSSADNYIGNLRADVTLSGKALKQGTDYTVAYSKNTNIGTAAITVTGKGSYTGTAKGSFKIVAPVVKASKVKKITVGKKKMTVTVKKVSGATAYKIQYKVKGAKKWKTKTAKKAKVTIKKLKKGKKYQVKVTAQKKVAKKTFSAKASKAKTSKKIK